MKATDTNDFFNSLNAGVFAQQVGQALSNVAAGVIDLALPMATSLEAA